jgi:hypothetical protein
MNANIYLLTILFSICSSLLLATPPDLDPRPVTPITPITNLAPLPPSEATFEDVTETLNLSTLKPAIPEEADFSECLPEKENTMRSEKSSHKEMVKLPMLNPGHVTLIIPTEADFE